MIKHSSPKKNPTPVITVTAGSPGRAVPDFASSDGGEELRSAGAPKCFWKQLTGVPPRDGKGGQEKHLGSPLPNDALVTVPSGIPGAAARCPPNNAVLGGHI